jgi:uncharacterized protein
MAVVVQPLGVKCNIRCGYCYQNPTRDAGNVPRGYDVSRMQEAIEREGGPFTLFGGEILLLPEADLEALLAWGCERYGSSSLQTNGTLVTERHIELFQRYRVNVGVSLDGPAECNDARWAGSLERTRAMTVQSETGLRALCESGIHPGLIITLNRCNAAEERLPLVHAWLRDLYAQGIRNVRLHLLEIETAVVRERYALSADENIAAVRSFRQLQRDLPELEFDIFTDLQRLLSGNDREITCVWNACDPYTTDAVRGVNGQGERSNCEQVNKEGVNFEKADRPGFERYLALYHTPQEYGGCKGCRFFLMCKGHCPGNAIGGDWRNRTEYCDVWKALFEQVESELLAAGQLPLSVSHCREELEEIRLEAWMRGRNLTISQCLDRLPVTDCAPQETRCDRAVS